MATLREAAQEGLDALTAFREWEMGQSYNKNRKTIIQQAFKAEEALHAALAQPEQEPVAWITGGGKGELWWHQSEKFDTEGNLIGKNQDDIPLYTAPPQRKWVGLTDEERYLGDARSEQEIEYAKTIEAKIKEKNYDKR